MHDGRALLAVAYVASAQSLEAALGDAIVRAIEFAAAPYAIALEREADRADVMHDALTGLLSPRALRHHLREEVALAIAARHRRVLCLWFVDTDRFKEVNDRFGHRAGDAVLQAMATLLETHLLADVDLAARNGGDEFCALLRGTSKGRAIERAQTFCDAVRRHDFGLPIRITASIGIATYPHDASSWNALLETADAAMCITASETAEIGFPSPSRRERSRRFVRRPQASYREAPRDAVRTSTNRLRSARRHSSFCRGIRRRNGRSATA